MSVCVWLRNSKRTCMDSSDMNLANSELRLRVDDGDGPRAPLGAAAPVGVVAAAAARRAASCVTRSSSAASSSAARIRGLTSASSGTTARRVGVAASAAAADAGAAALVGESPIISRLRRGSARAVDAGEVSVGAACAPAAAVGDSMLDALRLRWEVGLAGTGLNAYDTHTHTHTHT